MLTLYKSIHSGGNAGIPIYYNNITEHVYNTRIKCVRDRRVYTRAQGSTSWEKFAARPNKSNRFPRTYYKGRALEMTDDRPIVTIITILPGPERANKDYARTRALRPPRTLIKSVAHIGCCVSVARGEKK